MKQRHGFPWAFLMVSCGALAVGGGADSRALAQVKKGWEVSVAYKPTDAPKDAQEIALRPNATQSVYLYLRNKDLDEETNVEVRLLRGFSKENVQRWRELAKATMKEDFRKPRLVTFKPAAEPAKKEDAAKGPPTTSNDEGAPFLFQLAVTDEDKKTVTLELPVAIQPPQEYINASAKFDKIKNRLSAQLNIKAASADPPCPVELVLDPEVVPRPGGLSSDELNSMNLDAELHAEVLRFTNSIPPQNGRISLTVDGYKRAFQFKTTFDQGALTALKKNRVRLIAPRYFNPKPQDKAGAKGEAKPNPNIVVNIEADGTDAVKWIEVALDRSGKGKFVPLPSLLPGLREQTISFAVGPKGSPQFTTLVSDWKVPLDAAGVSGRKLVRVRLLDGKKDALALADEQNAVDEAVFLFSKDPNRNPFAQLFYRRVEKAVDAVVIVDDKGPEGLQFIDLPKKAAPGEKITITAMVSERDKVEQAPISKVQFFLGDSPKDPGYPGVYNPKSKLWQVTGITVPDFKEKLPVTVRATVATGLSASEEGTIAFRSAGEGSGEKSKITGLVKRDQQPQPNRDVTLAGGDKTKVNMKTKTNDKGVYVFLNVPPGKYTITATVPGYSKGIANAEVKKDTGEEISADITMK